MYLHDDDDNDKGGDFDCIWIERPFFAMNIGADQKRIKMMPPLRGNTQKSGLSGIDERENGNRGKGGNGSKSLNFISLKRGGG